MFLDHDSDGPLRVICSAAPLYLPTWMKLGWTPTFSIRPIMYISSMCMPVSSTMPLFCRAMMSPALARTYSAVE